MENSDEKMLLEVLRMARELVINEYKDRRAQEHNTWLYQSQELWRTKRLRLRYPNIPPHPTEKDVVERAQVLIKFLVLGKSENGTIVEGSNIVHRTEENTEANEQAQEPIIENETNPAPTSRILPSVLRKLEQMRKKI